MFRGLTTQDIDDILLQTGLGGVAEQGDMGHLSLKATLLKDLDYEQKHSLHVGYHWLIEHLYIRLGR
jgi:hypothetical protein